MSEPLTVWPMRASSSAIALMPAPATPTMCTRRGWERSRTASSATRVPFDEIGDACRGVGARQPARGLTHRVELRRIGEQVGDERVERLRIAFGVGQQHGRAGAFERLGVARLVVARRTREGYEDRRQTRRS